MLSRAATLKDFAEIPRKSPLEKILLVFLVQLY